MEKQEHEFYLYPGGAIVTFQNSKFFSGFPFNLQKINLLVGPNGSGKTTFLNYLRTANDLFSLSLDHLVANQNQLFKSASLPLIIKIEGRVASPEIVIEIVKNTKFPLFFDSRLNSDLLFYFKTFTYKIDPLHTIRVVPYSEESTTQTDIELGNAPLSEIGYKILLLKGGEEIEAGQITDGQLFEVRDANGIIRENNLLLILNNILGELKLSNTTLYKSLETAILCKPIVDQRFQSVHKPGEEYTSWEMVDKQLTIGELIRTHKGDFRKFKLIEAQHFEREEFIWPKSKGYSQLERLSKDSWLNQKLVSILKKFLFEGSIIEDIYIEERGDKELNLRAFRVFLSGRSGKKKLMKFPSGIQRLFWLFLEILTSEESWLGISEPETSLHPAFQSRLIEVLYELKDRGGQFRYLFLETHSEYIIRQAQLIRKRLGENEPNPFSVFYLDSKMKPKEMRMRTDGKFFDAFGPGFYNEASRQAFELW